MQVRFWGVRGSTPCAGPQYAEFGGHTSCTTITIGDTLIICDAGTGLFDAGEWIKQQKFQHASLFISHVHLDHVTGYPFFGPAWDPQFKLDIYSSFLEAYGGFEGFLVNKLNEPLFPVGLNSMGAHIRYHSLKAGDSFVVEPQVQVKTIALRHPGGSIGFRIEGGGKAVCYVTDTEHTPGQLDKDVLQLIKDADLVIYDASFTEDEYHLKVGWGHSTWQEGVRLCRASGAKRLALYHHAPQHTDNIMRALEQDAKAEWDGVFAARQGSVVEV